MSVKVTDGPIKTPLDRIRNSVESAWMQGKFGETDRADGPVCLYGALMRECHVHNLPDAMFYRIREVMSELLEEDGWNDITQFNDAADTDKEDVLNFIDRVKEEFRFRGTFGNDKDFI
jgi:hypothetical protein